VKKLLSRLFVGATVFLAGTATAADLSKAPPPLFGWSGCYAGGAAGLGAGHVSWRDVSTPGDIDAKGAFNIAESDTSGSVFGAQIGCDYQYASSWVFGISGMIARSDIAATNQDQFNALWTLRNRVDWLATIAGRWGYAIDRSLLYIRGGAAWTGNRLEIEARDFNLGTPLATRLGWTAGAGIEWAFAPRLSAFLEFNYYNFGTQNIGFMGNPAAADRPFIIGSYQTVETFQVGVNYRFWGL
jgi:outer membrane immunogenic protein